MRKPRRLLSLNIVCLLAALLICGASLRGVEPTTAPASADEVIQGMHEHFARMGKELGGYSDQETARLEAMQKTLDAQLKIDPAKPENKKFEEQIMEEFRNVLDAEHQLKFDAKMASAHHDYVERMTGYYLHKIGELEAAYKSKNDGRAAPDLGSLASLEATPNNFLVANSGTKKPDDWEKLDAAAKASWVEKKSDFVYLAPDPKGSVDPDFVQAYIKPEAFPDDNKFLMSDGRIESKKAEDAKAIIADLKTGKNPPAGLKK